MNGETYSMQWLQRGGMQQNKIMPQQLLLDAQRKSMDINHANTTAHFLTNGSDMQYLVGSAPDDDDLTAATLEQIAAENLIFMARDGQMELIEHDNETGGSVVLVAATTDCGTLHNNNSMANDEIYNDDFADSTPQMVTEEIITDDWVQHQGEERVEIPAEQIIGNNSQALLDMEVPLPTVQDEYSALRPFPCDFCSRRFRKKASLMNHMVAHQTDRTLLCKFCGLRFSRRSELINHLKAHADISDPETDSTELMNYHNQTYTTNQSSTNIQYYNDQEWQDDGSAHAHNYEHDRRLEELSSNTESNYVPATNTAKTTRGRISRLKPKLINYDNQESFVPNGNIKVEKESDNSTQQQQVYPVLDSSKPFVCQNCGLAFARQKALLSHVKTHRNDSPFECATCGDIFWEKVELQDHQRTHKFEESNSEYEPEQEPDESHTESEADNLYGEYYCSECGLSFHRQDLLRRHAKVHEKSNSNKKKSISTVDVNNSNEHCCSTCGENFAEALDLLAHAEVHARFPPFKCVLCGETFMEELTIKRHLQCAHAHEMTQNSCVLCGKECRDRRALIKHAWDHSREKCHTCSKCGKNFHNKARLKRHMASHRDKTVACDVCHEEFPDGRTLSNHRHSHNSTSSGKLFPCTVCGKTFGSRSSQQIHVRIHTGERPYGCRYCWKAFADGGTLRKHERIHTGEKPYACSVCPRAFNQRVVLREHIRSHHSRIDSKRGTYYCSACSTEMPSSAELLQHLIQHSDVITAMQRQPVPGPRKYKRRRKLKPHELAKFRNEGKTNSENTSDLDMSEFDIDQVDDLLDITGSSGTTPTNSNNNTCNDNEKKTRLSRGNNNKLANNNKNNSVTTINNVMEKQDEETELHFDMLDYVGNKKQRLDSTNSNCSEKLWPSASSLLSNMENTLQTIETLVVSNKKSTEKRTKAAKTGSSLSLSTITETTTTITTTSNLMAPNTRSGRKLRNVAVTKKEKEKNATRPRMIHTEKLTLETTRSSRRGKKTNATTSTNMIVSDYEIISPAAQPPAQISCTIEPIKQEMRILRADLYDAHLLLEASSLRKDQFDKFNPSLVNDLEEILRSPHKSGDQRRRFTSESSATQFLTEQSEEEQSNMIKIEPTSPDLHELIAGNTPTPPSTPQTVGRLSRHSRLIGMNRKYLDFDTTTHNRNRLGSTSKLVPASPSSSYLVDFDANGFGNSVVSSGNVSSDVTAAATAAAVAAEAAVTSSSNISPEQRKTRYFQCEMCSAIFSDRAQLLEHVNIHI